MTFQFFRAPKEGSQKPLQLPAGSAVDLLCSGVGDESFVPSATQPVIVTFNSAGQLDMVYSGAFPQGQKVTQNVFFLIGRPEGVNNSDNLKEKRSAWVSIASQSGLVGIDANAQIWEKGPDGQWGVASADDDGNGVTDDISESGKAGSDDVLVSNPDLSTLAAKSAALKSARRHAATGKGLGG